MVGIPDVFENIREAGREIVHAEVHFGIVGHFDNKGRKVFRLAADAIVKPLSDEESKAWMGHDIRWGFTMAYLPKDVPQQILCKFGDVEQIINWGDRFVYDAPQDDIKEN